MAGLKVLGRTTSINVRKVTWLLDELGVGYEREDWGLPLRDPKNPAFLTLNPNAQVPVLIEGDFVLWESNAIIRYLAAQHEQFLPTDLEGRALVDQWLYWQLGELNPAWGYAVNAFLRKNPAYNDPERIAHSVERWTAKLDVLEGQLRRHRHVAGDDFSVADVTIALSTHRWLSTPIPDRKAFPAIEDHYARMKARPAGAPWMTDATP
jgi:glutathione S-transferase